MGNEQLFSWYADNFDFLALSLFQLLYDYHRAHYHHLEGQEG